MGLNTTPRTWVAGEVVSASMMNAEIRDAVAGLQAPWADYAATVTGVGVSNLLSRFSRVGKTIDARITFTLTAPPSSIAVKVGVPVPMATGTFSAVGTATGVRSNVAFYTGPVTPSTATEVAIITAGGDGYWGSRGQPAAWVAGDIWSLLLRYEAA